MRNISSSPINMDWVIFKFNSELSDKHEKGKNYQVI